jgi:hypothetical protein
MKKYSFNNLSDEKKSEYYKNSFESAGIFSGLDLIRNSELYKKDINTKSFSIKIREKIERLLHDKNLVSSNESVHLEDLHKHLSKSMKAYDFNSGVNSISQQFYETDLEFRILYLDYVKELYNNFFHFPFYFQKIPTIRLHCPDADFSHHYPRYHTDIGYGHPPQEINLWVPLTYPVEGQKHGFRLMDLTNTRKVLRKYDYHFENLINDAIKSQEFNKDLNQYAPQVDTKFGDTLCFDSRCLHTGEPLVGHTRVSIDIRITPVDDFQREKFIFQGAGKMKMKYQPGQAYDTLSSDML